MNDPLQPDLAASAHAGEPIPAEPQGGGAPANAPDAAPAAPVAADAHDNGSDGDGEHADAPAGEPGTASATGPDGERRRRRRRRRGRGHRDGEPDGALQGPPLPPGHPAAPQRPAAVPPEQRRPQPPRERGERPSRRERFERERERDRERGRGTPHGALLAMRALSEMAQSLLKIEGVDPFSVPRYLDLQLRIPLDQNADVRGAATAAVEQILQRVREVREHERALRPGAVFCYFSGSAEVEHARPTEPRQVFEGYNSTGRPVFSDFVTMAIERKDAGIDQLLAGDDRILTHVTMGRVLRTQQLAEFGGESAVFKILGQVDAGLFRVLGAEQKCAFSFQLLRGKTLEGKPRLRLHVVGKVDLMDLADPGVLNILSRFQRHLDAESLRLQGKEHNGEVDDEAFVLPLLQDLAQKLAGRARSTGRRTQHALARSEEGQRPTPRAYPDAGEAADDAILWDTEKGTIVVVGPKGRVHVFTPQARHVTSVMMQGSAIDRRRQQSRWRAAEPEERGEFRVQLKRLVAAGEDKPVEGDVGLPEP